VFTHYCTVVDGFVRNLLIRKSSEKQEMDCGGRDTVLQDSYDIDSLVISIETVKRQASSLKCSPVTSGPSEPRREMQVPKVGTRMPEVSPEGCSSEKPLAR
jgi:hypothetical protein